MLFCTDNTTAVNVITKLWSRSPTPNAVARSLTALTKTLQLAGIAATHIPGVDNVIADEGSRRAEALYGSQTLSLEALNWIRTKGVELAVPIRRVGGILPPHGSNCESTDHHTRQAAPTLWCPPPMVMEAAIGAALRGARRGAPQLLLLPQLSGQMGLGEPPSAPPKGGRETHRWWPLLRRGKARAVARFPKNIPLFSSRAVLPVSAAESPFSGTPCIDRFQRGQWFLWRFPPRYSRAVAPFVRHPTRWGPIVAGTVLLLPWTWLWAKGSVVWRLVASSRAPRPALSAARRGGCWGKRGSSTWWRPSRPLQRQGCGAGSGAPPTVTTGCWVEPSSPGTLFKGALVVVSSSEASEKLRPSREHCKLFVSC